MNEPGQSYPLGAWLYGNGANFSVYSREASGVDLLFFEHEDDTRPSRVVSLNPAVNRSYHYWHTFVPVVKTGQIYGYRVSGPWDPARGLRFDSSKVLLDPYGRSVAVPKGYSRQTPEPAMKSVVVDSHV